MKKILIKRDNSKVDKFKSMCISNRTEDKDAKTLVRKKFNYLAAISKETKPKIEAPEVHIFKSFDTAKGIEKFSFRVVGSMYLNHKEQLIKVNFKHSLNIHIYWKQKIFSPKKSAVLTE